MPPTSGAGRRCPAGTTSRRKRPRRPTPSCGRSSRAESWADVLLPLPLAGEGRGGGAAKMSALVVNTCPLPPRPSAGRPPPQAGEVRALLAKAVGPLRQRPDAIEAFAGGDVEGLLARPGERHVG